MTRRGCQLHFSLQRETDFDMVIYTCLVVCVMHAEIKLLVLSLRAVRGIRGFTLGHVQTNRRRQGLLSSLDSLYPASIIMTRSQSSWQGLYVNILKHQPECLGVMVRAG